MAPSSRRILSANACSHYGSSARSRERRAQYEGNMSLVREALEAGTNRARVIAKETMEMVRDALDLNSLSKVRVPALTPSPSPDPSAEGRGEGSRRGGK